MSALRRHMLGGRLSVTRFPESMTQRQSMSAPPSAFYIFSGVGMMAVAAVSVLLWKRVKVASWAVFGLGALAWVVSVVLKFGWSVPTNRFIKHGLDDVLPAQVSDPVCLRGTSGLPALVLDGVRIQDSRGHSRRLGRAGVRDVEIGNGSDHH